MRAFIKRIDQKKEQVLPLARYGIINRYLEEVGDQAGIIAVMTPYMIPGERKELSEFLIFIFS